MRRGTETWPAATARTTIASVGLEIGLETKPSAPLFTASRARRARIAGRRSTTMPASRRFLRSRRRLVIWAGRPRSHARTTVVGAQTLGLVELLRRSAARPPTTSMPAARERGGRAAEVTSSSAITAAELGPRRGAESGWVDCKRGGHSGQGTAETPPHFRGDLVQVRAVAPPFIHRADRSRQRLQRQAVPEVRALSSRSPPTERQRLRQRPNGNGNGNALAHARASGERRRRRLRLLGPQPRPQRRRAPRPSRSRPSASAIPRAPPRSPQRVPGVPVLADLDAALAAPGRGGGHRRDARRAPTTPICQAGARGRQARAGREAAGHHAGDDAEELVTTAEELGQVLMPGHTFVYSPSVNKMRDLIREDVLGDVYFVTSSRMNLGKYQHDGVDLRPRAARPLDPAVLARAAGHADRHERAQRVPGRRARDGLPVAHLRGRHRGERPDLLARAAQSPPDGRRRQQAHGPVRRHRLRRVRARLRPRHGVLDARELRRVPAHLPQRRRADAAHRAGRAAEPRARGLRHGDPHRARAALERAARPRDRAARSRPPSSRCAAAASPSSLAPVGVPAAASGTASRCRGPATRRRRARPLRVLHGPLLGLPHRLAHPAPGARARRARRRGRPRLLLARPASSRVGDGRIRIHEVPGEKAGAGARRVPARATARFFAHALWKVSRLARAARFDVVEAHNMPDFLIAYAGAAAKLRGAAMILNVHDTFPELFATKFELPEDASASCGRCAPRRVGARAWPTRSSSSRARPATC